MAPSPRGGGERVVEAGCGPRVGVVERFEVQPHRGSYDVLGVERSPEARLTHAEMLECSVRSQS
ncbi:hypothetical protein U9M48_022776 [Paspalum notatum var. saurae]|uniref:Uncharacterized protein n=1 Tax=Paspalum notatum var. saurae TaxID=547442 RepID=A0AAQ3TN04_PASNO